MVSHYVQLNVHLMYVACCGMLWHVVECCGLLWHAVACCGMLWHVVECCGLLWHAVACCGMLWSSRVHTQGYIIGGAPHCTSDVHCIMQVML